MSPRRRRTTGLRPAYLSRMTPAERRYRTWARQCGRSCIKYVNLAQRAYGPVAVQTLEDLATWEARRAWRWALKSQAERKDKWPLRDGAAESE